jgi:hypothetical protein
MNRNAKRKMISEMQTHCCKIAAMMAANSYDYARSGVPTLITNKIALATLAQAYKKFIKNDCRLITQRITFEQSRAFPRNSVIKVPACSVLAVHQDIKTHFVYGLQYCDAEYLSEAERYEIAKTAAIEEVRSHASYAGFPINNAIGFH